VRHAEDGEAGSSMAKITHIFAGDRIMDIIVDTVL
jgi:hypothetical protein